MFEIHWLQRRTGVLSRTYLVDTLHRLSFSILLNLPCLKLRGSQWDRVRKAPKPAGPLFTASIIVHIELVPDQHKCLLKRRKGPKSRNTLTIQNVSML